MPKDHKPMLLNPLLAIDTDWHVKRGGRGRVNESAVKRLRHNFDKWRGEVFDSRVFDFWGTRFYGMGF